MNRTCLLALLAAALAGCATPQAEDAGESNAVVIEAPAVALVEVQRLVDAKKYPEAGRLLDGIVTHPSFDSVHPWVHNRSLYLAGWVAHRLGNYPKAHSFLVRASASEFANHWNWLFRMSAARETGNMSDAIASLTTFAQRWPAEIRRVPTQNVYQLLNESRKPEFDRERSFELHRLLFEANWHPLLDIEPSSTWKDLALLWIERGQLDKAEEVVARVEDPDALMGMRVDKRFDALQKKYPQRFDVRAALDRHLAKTRKRAEDNPRSLNAFVQLTYALLSAKRFDEVLALSEPFTGYKAPTDSFVLRYDDWDQVIWVLNNRAKALQAVGRYDESVELLRTTARKAEGGDVNVSQAINLGMLLCRMERPQEALDTVGIIGSMSPYGRMMYESVRLNASLQLKDAKQVEASTAYLREHRYDSLRAYQYALIKLGQLDEAAGILIGRLEDLRYRSDALGEMQDTWSPPGPPGVKAAQGNWANLLERKDVKAAIDRVGRIESFDFLYSG